MYNNGQSDPGLNDSQNRKVLTKVEITRLSDLMLDSRLREIDHCRLCHNNNEHAQSCLHVLYADITSYTP